MENVSSKNKRKERRIRRLQDFWSTFSKNKAALVCLFILLLFLLVMIFADLIVPYESAITTNAKRLDAPSAEHWFGTDTLGRDVFARIIHGSRYSISIAVITVAFSVGVGCIIGAFAGISNSRVDDVIMRICDIFESLPPTILCMAIVASLGTGYANLVVALSISTIPSVARLVRTSVLTISEEDYIEAARVYGCSRWRLMMRYMLPNAMGPLIVKATMSVKTILVSAAALSFLGMGAQPPTPEWGSMLSEASGCLRAGPHMLYFPALAIFLVALSFNMVGDGLRDALDPRLKN